MSLFKSQPISQISPADQQSVLLWLEENLKRHPYYTRIAGRGRDLIRSGVPVIENVRYTPATIACAPTAAALLIRIHFIFTKNAIAWPSFLLFSESAN